MFKKIIKYLVIINLILFFAISLLYLNFKINKVGQVINELQSDIFSRYEETLDNEILLLQQIQKLERNIETLDINNLLKTDVFVRGIFGIGAGTVIKKTDNGMYILTCAHVVQEIYEINKMGISYSGTLGYSKNDKGDELKGLVLYAYKIIKYDKDNDLALIKTSIIDDNLKVAKLAEKEPEKGEIVYSIGSSLGLLRVISKGILSHKQDGFYFSDNTTTFGNSGGGLYNSKGELIGVPSNVMGYTIARKLKLELKLTDEELKFVPETSLGLSISLFRIKKFLGEINEIL